MPAGNECDRATAESGKRALSPSDDVGSSVLSGEERDKCVSCVFSLRSHGGEVGRRVIGADFGRRSDGSGGVLVGVVV